MFVKELKNQESEEGRNVTLRCELSKAGVPAEWLKEEEVLSHGMKYLMRHVASIQELVIRNPLPEDSGTYSCVCRGQQTKAIIKINGWSCFWANSALCFLCKFCKSGISNFAICRSNMRLQHFPNHFIMLIEMFL